MCGLAALFCDATRSDLHTPMRRMLTTVAHRGPDGEGMVFGRQRAVVTADEPADWALGHKRLAILDLSTAGLQPMASADRQLWVTYNGEIFNYIELAEQLRQSGHCFQTGTDTEVLLAAYRAWGPSCVERFRGMFAMVLVDLGAGRIWAARDRLGVKPLYIWCGPHQVAVVSEIKQLIQLDGFQPCLNRQQAVDYLCEGLLGHELDQTMFRDVRPLTPGCYLQWPIGQRPNLNAQQQYWSPPRLTQTQTWESAVARTGQVFREAVRLRMRSDVAVGTCLSGGIDSSSIVGVAALDLGASMKTFSVCHDDPRISEETYIDAVAHHCHTESIKLRLTEQQLLDDLDQFIYHQDEPVYSSSQYAEFAVMRLARQNHVTVLLNGQGGDEAMCGYRKFAFFFLRQLLRDRRLGAAMQHTGQSLVYGDRQLFQFWQGVRYVPDWLRRRYDPFDRWLRAPLLALRRGAWRQRMQDVTQLHDHQWADLRYWSLPVLLRYQDRNSMAHGIEARVPMVDHHFLELMLTMPEEYFFRHGKTKRLLVDALGDRLPEALRRRRTKLGFDTPQGQWLRGRLGEVLEDRVRRCQPLDALVDRTACGQAFRDYRRGANDVPHFVLFRVACLAIWMERFAVCPGSEPE
jgi:asparagine synthase (glutamine-hydrolysing)